MPSIEFQRRLERLSVVPFRAGYFDGRYLLFAMGRNVFISARGKLWIEVVQNCIASRVFDRLSEPLDLLFRLICRHQI